MNRCTRCDGAHFMGGDGCWCDRSPNNGDRLSLALIWAERLPRQYDAAVAAWASTLHVGDGDAARILSMLRRRGQLGVRVPYSWSGMPEWRVGGRRVGVS